MKEKKYKNVSMKINSKCHIQNLTEIIETQKTGYNNFVH